MRDSIIRTVVPLLVAVLIGWAARAGLNLPENVLTELLTVVIGFLYYAGARWVERDVSPRVGQVLLSAGVVKTTPRYQETTSPVE